MKRLITLAKYFLVGWISSILLSVMTALLAYWKSGISPVIQNALSCAMTGGFGGHPVDDAIWKTVILVPCMAYAITGLLLLLSLLIILVVRILQLLFTLIGKSKLTKPAA